MLKIVSGHKRFFSVFAMAITFVFTLSSVSLAYSSIMCKMQKTGMAEEMDAGSCCCIMNKTENNSSNNTGAKPGDVSIKKLHTCCCSVSKKEGPAIVFTTVTNSTNNETKDFHNGAVIYTLPNPYYNNTHTNVSPGDGSPVSGRSIIISNSNFRI